MAKIMVRTIGERLDKVWKSINGKIERVQVNILSELRKKKIFWKVLFLFIFLVLGVLAIRYLSTHDEYIPYDEYRYGFGGEIKVLRDVKINHDFSKNTGVISFKIERSDLVNELSAIDIDLPSVSNNKSIRVYTGLDNLQEYHEWEPSIGQLGLKNYTSLRIFNITKPKSGDVFFSIEYPLKILPNGQIVLSHGGINFWGKITIFDFDLGKDYRCEGSCIQKLYEFEPDYPNTQRNIRLRIIRDNPDKTPIYWHYFILTTIRDLRIGQSFWTGVLASAVVAFLVILKELFEELQNIESRKKKKIK